MKGLSIKLSIFGTGGDRVRRLFKGLRSRIEIHDHISVKVWELTRKHLLKVKDTRHKTAQQLGAKPTGHWSQAAEKTTRHFDEQGITVTVNQVGISRVGGDIEIRPKTKKFLTLPMIAAAYGQRAYRVPGLFVFKGKMGGLFLAKSEGEKLSIWYRLLKSVKQKQDRSLLPDDAEYTKAALLGIDAYMDELLSKRGGAAK